MFGEGFGEGLTRLDILLDLEEDLLELGVLDLLGDAVNVAARLQGLAVPGGIWVARSVQEQVQAKHRPVNGLKRILNFNDRFFFCCIFLFQGTQKTFATRTC